MEKDFEVSVFCKTLNIVLGKDLATDNATYLGEELDKYKYEKIDKVVFDATKLEYISSFGVRAVMLCLQRYNHSEVEFVNAGRRIIEVFEMTGLNRYIKFVKR